MDLTKIEKPFGLLTAEEQAALKAHGGPYQWYSSFGWTSADSPDWQPYFSYRVAPMPPTKPIIDWTALDKCWRWLARDKNGRANVFISQPRLQFAAGRWDGVEARCVDGVLSSYSPGACDWSDSLVERPEDA